MSISKELTKEMLIEMNISCEYLDVYHYSKRLGNVKLTPCLNVALHPKGIIGRCVYLNVGWYHKGRQYVYPYHRVLYAWYYGIAHEGMDIMHIDGNSLNNDIKNLKEGTHKENLGTRKGARNHLWKRSKKYDQTTIRKQD